MAQPLKKTLIHTLIYGLSIILTKGVSVILTPFYTTILQSAGDYGKYNYFLVAIASISVLLTFGLETAYFNFITKKDNENLEGRMFSLHILIALLSGLTFFTFQNELAFWIVKANGYSSYFLLTIGIILFDLLCVIPLAKIRRDGRPTHYAIIQVSYVSVTLLLNLLFLKWLPSWKDAYHWDWIWNIDSDEFVFYILLATLIGSIVKFLFVLPQIRHFKFEFNLSENKKYLNYSLPIMIGGMAYVINEMIDREFIKGMLDDHEKINGIYSANYKIAGLLAIMITGFRLGVEPFIFKQADKKNAKKTYALLLKLLVVSMTIAGLGIVFNEDLLQTFFVKTKEYHVGFNAVPPLILAMLFSGMYYNLSVWYKIENKTRYGMYFSIAGALVTLLLNWLLVKDYGYIACAWATTACYFVMCSLSYIFGQKHYKIPYQVNRILIYLLLGISCYFVGIELNKIHILLDNILLFVFIGVAFSLEKNDIYKLKQKTL